MDRKNRTVIVVLIAIVIAVAVFASFGLYFLPGQTPRVTLPATLGADSSEEPAGSPSLENDRYTSVDVTVDTVQAVIATLVRADSYERKLYVWDFWGEEDYGVTDFTVWVDNGCTRIQAQLPSGRQQNTLVVDGTLYLWYDQDRSCLTFDGGSESPDLLQRFPTYEDVLNVEKSDITGAGCVTQDNWTCVYVEVEDPGLNYLYRYWVDIDSGLLVRAETEEDGQVIYRMSSAALQSPCPASAPFQLPDGTVLHQAG